jgi:hypothetical protein
MPIWHAREEGVISMSSSSLMTGALQPLEEKAKRKRRRKPSSKLSGCGVEVYVLSSSVVFLNHLTDP